jgi:hypothetical protein
MLRIARSKVKESPREVAKARTNRNLVGRFRIFDGDDAAICRVISRQTRRL